MELFIFLVCLGIFHVGAWYGRQVERQRWERRERSRLAHKYAKEVN